MMLSYVIFIYVYICIYICKIYNISYLISNTSYIIHVYIYIYICIHIVHHILSVSNIPCTISWEYMDICLEFPCTTNAGGNCCARHSAGRISRCGRRWSTGGGFHSHGSILIDGWPMCVYFMDHFKESG